MDKIKRPAELRHLNDLLSFIIDFAKNGKMDDEAMAELRLAMEEALVNIISYAYPEGSPGDILVECSLTESGDMSVKLTDWGIPFDPSEKRVPDFDAPMCERGKGGLGIFLTKSFADELEYVRGKEKNELIIVKRIGSS
jgi:anti-sigma regulatory factor (Ser/Thr protein kinase)